MSGALEYRGGGQASQVLLLGTIQGDQTHHPGILCRKEAYEGGDVVILVVPSAAGYGLLCSSGLTAAIHAQEGAHLPGDGRGAKRRQAREAGVAVNVATLERIEAILG